MSHVTLEKILADIHALPPDKQAELIRRLLAERKTSEENDGLPIRPRRVTPRFTSKDRTREMQWVEAHREQYAGQWVALEGETLIGHGLDAREVFAAADQSGIDRPLVIQIEPHDELPFAGW